MEIKEVVCKGYVMNARNRRHQCERWSEWLGLMPMGEPITASQLADLISREHNGSWYFSPSPQAVTAMLSAMRNVGAVMRMEVAIEPYEIEVERPMVWNYSLHCYVEQPPKKIIIDKKTVFIRME